MMQKGELLEQRFHTGTVELNYAEGQASGEALLYLHGGNGRWQEGRALLEELASAFQVYGLERLRTWSLRARPWSLSLAGLRPRCGDLSGAGREQANRRHWPLHGGLVGNISHLRTTHRKQRSKGIKQFDKIKELLLWLERLRWR